MRRLVSAIVLLAAALAGCGKHATEPPPSDTSGPPPALVATQPPARSTGALYDGEIWAQFDRPLDGRTVSGLTVFLKLDGQRVPDTVSYDGITRRILLRPKAPLALQRTYTVEFSTAIKSLEGTPLPPGVFFQFTTNSLFRIVYDYPVLDALEGPVSCLGWGGTRGPDGNILYEVYAGTDSLAVARRAVPLLQKGVLTRLLPTVAWPMGTRMFWAVTSENVTTHERMDGTVQSFRVLDASTPVETVVLLARDHASNDIRNANTQYCARLELPAGPSFNAALHWSYTQLGADARLASAVLTLTFLDINAGRFNSTRPTAWLAQNDWNACAVRAPGPPFADISGLLASATPAPDGIHMIFTSERLAASLEAAYRQRTLVYTTLIRTLDNVTFHSPLVADPTKVPTVTVQVYRLPPAPTP